LLPLTPIFPYLSRQFERARPILFTGAGFSLAAKNLLGRSVASLTDVKSALWNLCFPGTEEDPESNLQALYETAQLQQRTKISELLSPMLAVDADSIPGWYAAIFSLPWHKCYTLNIDDLDAAISRTSDLPRRIAPVSAESATTWKGGPEALEVVHLNGMLADIPDDITFSASQYAERLAREDPVYMGLAAELLSHPFVFIGTKLDEPPLWQHIQLRFSKGRRMKELRPQSYLLTPTLDKAREVSLSQFNIDWLNMTAESFAQNAAKLSEGAAKGLAYLSSGSQTVGLTKIPEVTEVATEPNKRTLFLLGSEPIWADVQSGRAIERESDSELCTTLMSECASAVKKMFVVSGTAGSGKSTTLMRAALYVSNEGLRVGWIDRETNIAPRAIRSQSKSGSFPDAVFIDDADIYGPELSTLIRDLVFSGRRPLVVIGLRSGKVDRALNPALLKEVNRAEMVMPHLADSDIEDLIHSLDRENRLGKLKGLGFAQQVAAFREQAGRQLLVAMIQATSGTRFEEKAVDEFRDLQGDAQNIYALLCVATFLGFTLSRSEILVASSDSSNATLNALDELVRRNIVVQTTDRLTYRARHGVIAEIVFEHLKNSGLLYEILSGLAKIAATETRPGMPRSARPMRLLIRVLSHDFLHRCLGVNQARILYNDLEQQLDSEAHFWLQRASLELEDGIIGLAENFIYQARGMAPDDPLIEIKFAHFLFQKALHQPKAIDAPDFVANAMGLLRVAAGNRGKTDAHPYHILGSQGLAWSRRGLDTFEKKRDYLEELRHVMLDAVDRHPRDNMIKAVHQAIEEEYLSLAVRV
jgi:hypothetical protein